MTSNLLLSNRVFMDARSAEYSTVVGVQTLQRFTDDQTNAYLWPLLVLNWLGLYRDTAGMLCTLCKETD